MRVAFISPFAHLLDLPETGYDMVLAGHLQHEVYRAFHTPEARRHRPSNHITILDNGAAEGILADFSTLEAGIRALQPNIFIVPDVMDSVEGTVHEARAWMESSAWRRCIGYLGEKAPALMVVPHGKNFQEWLWCLQDLMKLKPRPRYVGIAKMHTNLGQQSLTHGRASLVRAVCEGFPRARIHLLGLAGSPIELAIINKLEWKCAGRVLGVDTALPWVIASNFQMLHPLGYLVRPSSWHSDESQELTPWQVGAAKYNAGVILRLAGAL